MDKIVYEAMETHEGDWWMRGRSVIIQTLLDSTDRKASIIDLGAGVGQIASVLRNSGFRKMLVTDSSEQAIKLLKEKGFRAKKAALPHLGVKEKFDRALLLDVLEHIDDDRASLNSVYSLLNPNGQLILTVPAFKFLWSRKDELVHHKRRYSLRELSSKLEEAGFKIKYISFYNFFLFLPAVLFALVNKRTVKLSRYSKRRDKIFYPIFSSERYFIRNGVKFPIGVSLIAVVEKA